jgi:hypothetical protein
MDCSPGVDVVIGAGFIILKLRSEEYSLFVMKKSQKMYFENSYAGGRIYITYDDNIIPSNVRKKFKTYMKVLAFL